MRIVLSIFLSFVMLIASPSIATSAQFISYSKTEMKYEMMWTNATDYERYNMSTAVKAYACGLSYYDFVFFAKVVEGEGYNNYDDITDKVLVACTVLNRVSCESWPTTRVISTLKRPGQFEVVNSETGECNHRRSLDSEWAIVEAYRLVGNGSISCHMVYYNAIGFTGYSRSFIDYAYFGGNYFSLEECQCDSCIEKEPDIDYDNVEMLDDEFRIFRPSE